MSDHACIVSDPACIRIVKFSFFIVDKDAWLFENFILLLSFENAEFRRQNTGNKWVHGFSPWLNTQVMFKEISLSCLGIKCTSKLIYRQMKDFPWTLSVHNPMDCVCYHDRLCLGWKLIMIVTGYYRDYCYFVPKGRVLVSLGSYLRSSRHVWLMYW